jgi:pimeloyl-ACP methyl ester carboxylesterase
MNKATAKTLNSNNRVFHYFDEGTGSKTILFLHGMAAGKEATWNMFHTLSDKYRCIHLDLPGHNQADLTNIESVSDIVNYISDFVHGMNLTKFYIMGFSLGGMIGSEIVNSSNIKDQVEGLIVWASPILGVKKGVALKARAVYYVLKRSPDNLFSAVCKWPTLDKIRKLLGVNLNQVEAQLAANFTLKNRVKINDIIEKWNYTHNYGIPKLFIYGSNDPVVNGKNALFLSECKDKNCKTVVQHNAGHYGTRKAWNDALEHVREFVG